MAMWRPGSLRLLRFSLFSRSFLFRASLCRHSEMYREDVHILENCDMVRVECHLAPLDLPTSVMQLAFAACLLVWISGVCSGAPYGSRLILTLLADVKAQQVVRM